MTYLHQDRPFNIRYSVREHQGKYTPELLRTHRTAVAGYLYINRLSGQDEFGPRPDLSDRGDLIASGRCAPARAQNPALLDIGLWQQADIHAKLYRPEEPVCAHLVGSLPIHDEPAAWRHLIEGFAEDHLVAQGMVADWAIHYRSEEEGMPAICPHVHMLVTTRCYDPTAADVGRIRQTWLRTDKARKAIAEKWWAHSGLYPRCYGIAA